MISEQTKELEHSSPILNVNKVNVITSKCSPSYLMNFGGSVRVNPTGVAILCGVIILLVYLNGGGGGGKFRDRTSLKTSGSGQTVNLKELLAVAISAAEAGGREVKAVRKEADIGETSKGKTREGANDPKTDGDMRSHVQMYYGIKKAFPTIQIISEEHDESEVDLTKVQNPSLTNTEVDQKLNHIMIEVPADDVAVWIDPLDATQEYTEKLLQYVTTMVCVAVKGVPTIGVIHKPFANESQTSWGWADQNVVSKSVEEAAANNKNVKPDLSKARIIVSRSHTGDVKEKAEKTLGSGITVTPAGGAGYKSLEVVKGTQDAYIHTTLIKKWDICAGNAILNALNGKQTTLKGDEIEYDRADQDKNEGGLLATMHSHDQFLEKLKELQS